MKIAFDIDGVLARFTAESLFKRLYGIDMNEVPQKTFNYHEYHPKITSEMESRVFEEIKHIPNFWYNLEPINLKDAELIQSLCIEHDVYFITSRSDCYVGDVKSAAQQTINWLAKMGIDKQVAVLVTARKAEVCDALKIDYILDDRYDNFWYINTQEILSYGHGCHATCYLLDTSYNNDSEWVKNYQLNLEKYRVSSISEFIEAIGASS